MSEKQSVLLDVNWSSFREFNPKEIRKSKDLTTLKKFIEMFQHFSLHPNDVDATKDSLFHLLELSKLSVVYLTQYQKKLGKVVEQRSLEMQRLRDELDLTQSSYKKAKDTINQLKNAAQCPICFKNFNGIHYLDKHFEKNHHQFCHEWNIIRQKEQPDYDSELKDKVVERLKDLNGTPSETPSSPDMPYIIKRTISQRPKSPKFVQEQNNTGPYVPEIEVSRKSITRPEAIIPSAPIQEDQDSGDDLLQQVVLEEIRTRPQEITQEKTEVKTERPPITIIEPKIVEEPKSPPRKPTPSREPKQVKSPSDIPKPDLHSEDFDEESSTMGKTIIIPDLPELKNSPNRPLPFPRIESSPLRSSGERSRNDFLARSLNLTQLGIEFDVDFSFFDNNPESTMRPEDLDDAEFVDEEPPMR